MRRSPICLELRWTPRKGNIPLCRSYLQNDTFSNSIFAITRYASGTKAILESYLSGKHDYQPQDLIVKDVSLILPLLLP